MVVQLTSPLTKLIKANSLACKCVVKYERCTVFVCGLVDKIKVEILEERAESREQRAENKEQT